MNTAAPRQAGIAIVILCRQLGYFAHTANLCAGLTQICGQKWGQARLNICVAYLIGSRRPEQPLRRNNVRWDLKCRASPV
jgi:hypothetical protein